MSAGMFAFRPNGERFYFDASIHHAVSSPRINLAEIAVDSMVSIVLAEGPGLSQHAELLLRLVVQAQSSAERFARLHVVRSLLDPELIRLNADAGYPVPEMEGVDILVDYSCTYRPRCMPPKTLIASDAIVIGQHLFMNIAAPTMELPNRAFAYHADVLYAQAFPA